MEVVAIRKTVFFCSNSSNSTKIAAFLFLSPNEIVKFFFRPCNVMQIDGIHTANFDVMSIFNVFHFQNGFKWYNLLELRLICESKFTNNFTILDEYQMEMENFSTIEKFC